MSVDLTVTNVQISQKREIFVVLDYGLGLWTEFKFRAGEELFPLDLT